MHVKTLTFAKKVHSKICSEFGKGFNYAEKYCVKISYEVLLIFYFFFSDK